MGSLTYIYIYVVAGLEEVMEFLECSFPDVEIAIAHGKVVSSIIYYIICQNTRIILI